MTLKKTIKHFKFKLAKRIQINLKQNGASLPDGFPPMCGTMPTTTCLTLCRHQSVWKSTQAAAPLSNVTSKRGEHSVSCIAKIDFFEEDGLQANNAGHHRRLLNNS